MELGGPEIKMTPPEPPQYPQRMPFRPDEKLNVKAQEVHNGVPVFSDVDVVEEGRKLFQAAHDAGGINPKDAMGAKKPDLSLNPPAALVYMALAMANGKKKYGRANYRDSKILGTVYVAAAIRHLQAWLDGEEFSDDTNPPVPHLGHNLASIGILIDAIENGNFIDDRPKPGTFSATVNKFTVK